MEKIISDTLYNTLKVKFLKYTIFLNGKDSYWIKKKRQKNGVKLTHLTKLLILSWNKQQNSILKTIENSKETEANGKNDDNEGWKQFGRR